MSFNWQYDRNQQCLRYQDDGLSAGIMGFGQGICIEGKEKVRWCGAIRKVGTDEFLLKALYDTLEQALLEVEEKWVTLTNKPPVLGTKTFHEKDIRIRTWVGDTLVKNNE